MNSRFRPPELLASTCPGPQLQERHLKRPRAQVQRRPPPKGAGADDAPGPVAVAGPRRRWTITDVPSGRPETREMGTRTYSTGGENATGVSGLVF